MYYLFNRIVAKLIVYYHMLLVTYSHSQLSEYHLMNFCALDEFYLFFFFSLRMSRQARTRKKNSIIGENNNFPISIQ